MSYLKQGALDTRMSGVVIMKTWIDTAKYATYGFPAEKSRKSKPSISKVIMCQSSCQNRNTELPLINYCRHQKEEQRTPS